MLWPVVKKVLCGSVGEALKHLRFSNLVLGQQLLPDSRRDEQAHRLARWSCASYALYIQSKALTTPKG